MFCSCIKKITVFFLCLSLVVLLSLTVGVIACGVWARTAVSGELSEDLFFSVTADRTTRLYYETESGEMVELVADRVSGSENALYCPIEEISSDLIQAFIAIEDKRFFEHGGIDWARTASAVREYAQKGSAHFGGSTITQQLIKNLTGESERSISRKVSELMRAAKLEKRLEKREILEQYLNIVNLAQGCYGVKTAANAYFSKEPKDLTLREAATIAAITNNPAKYDPIRHPEANRERRDIILREMLAQGRITEERYESAVTGDTALCVSEEALSGRVNSWFADLVIRDVIGDLMREKGMSEAAASRLVYCGGLRIYTTVDPRVQAVLEEYYRTPDSFPTHSNGKKAQSAMMIVDPQNGNVLAVVGAVGEKTGNRVQSFATDAKRPSGSVIKPLSVYAPALEKGMITSATVFDDIPKSFRKNGAPWPRNSPDIYRGLTTVSDALTHSVNTVAVSVLEKLGNRVSYRYLTEQLGFRSLDPAADVGVAALALGQQNEGVTLSELLGGYTALANGGAWCGTRSYTKVVDSGERLLLERKSGARQVLDPDNAAIMTMMLRRVALQGTAKSLTLTEKVDVAGKTGTSSNNCDKWFVGYTPELLAGVWYGYEYPESLADVKGNPAVKIFDEIMSEVVEIRGAAKRQFDTEGDLVAVRYCKDSGKLPSAACALDPRGERTEIGYFKRGTEPTQGCDCHVCVSYCSKGGVANADCPEDCCKTVALIRAMRRFPRQIKVLDAPYTYGGAIVERGRMLSNNEPYYAKSYGSSGNFGIGMDTIPYNRACPGHAEDEGFWARRRTLA